MGLKDGSEELQLVREAIAEEAAKLGQDVSPKDVWIDILKEPNFKEGMLWSIKTYDELGYKMLSDIFPVTEWVKAFSENKWQGYVFTWRI